ncbi:unnamed protein product (plasmid) [Mycetohabitans rhizoxinica HKI 454]|uniref:Lipoprotein n=2 Tax=Mycetohabitans rhizoxinica TaxID=412963 RepID=E5ATU7_MYCRK|nr:MULTISPECIES: hypothetical protein [Mycetohabitans]MCF7697201.1 hypothetical protein [Mycetohabitans sp. B2]MCG1048627.1 hypothetical protein [Mycetohabitans sp. B6]CBW76521.1 unnamed protein product [Mycetohabitans rhizoxinica HKI 454]
MTKPFVLMFFAVALSGCMLMQYNPDAGEPEKVASTGRSTQDVIACMTDVARRHHASFRTSPIPQGQMLDFGDSNIVKIRTDDDGSTSFRFYPGKRHPGNLWIEGAARQCADIP